MQALLTHTKILVRQSYLVPTSWVPPILHLLNSLWLAFLLTMWERNTGLPTPSRFMPLNESHSPHSKPPFSNIPTHLRFELQFTTLYMVVSFSS